MRLGLYGGTFDPVHFGHLLLAERCREELELDEVRFLPAGDPPHKTRTDLTPGKQRAEMLDFATAGHPQLTVDRRELKRPGRSYTYQTLEEIHGESPDAELFFLMGADSLADLPQWREPGRIAELATVVAVNRADHALPDQTTLVATLGETIANRVRFVAMPGIDLSATHLRQRVAAGKSIRYCLPPAVEAYIQTNTLYRGNVERFAERAT